MILLLSSGTKAQTGEFDDSPPYDSFYNGYSEGCLGRNINQDIFWLDYDTDMSLSSIAFGYLPDTNNGPSFFARLDSGQSGMFRKSRDKTVFLSWSLGVKSCIVKTSFNKCKSANKAFKLLAKTKIPVNTNFDNKMGMGAIHATSYFLIVKDGENNLNKWSVGSGNNTIVRNIEKASELLKGCSSEALKELNKLTHE